jgi:predicted ATPase
MAEPTLELTAADAAAVTELCRYLGGLPLALELAAARAAVLPPAELLTRVRTSSEPIGPARRDAPARQRTLQATIDWSYDLLEPAERALFARLALFAGTFTADGAAAVCADLDISVLDGRAAVLDHGLIHREPARCGGRLAMLEPIRDYARERLQHDRACGDAAHRYAEHYATFAEHAQTGLDSSAQLEWLVRLDDEQANLRAVLHGATSQPQLDLALRIAAALTHYWHIRDLSAESETGSHKRSTNPPAIQRSAPGRSTPSARPPRRSGNGHRPRSRSESAWRDVPITGTRGSQLGAKPSSRGPCGAQGTYPRPLPTQQALARWPPRMPTSGPARWS